MGIVDIDVERAGKSLWIAVFPKIELFGFDF